MNTLKESQDFAVQENISFIADKTIEDIEELSELCKVLPNLSEFNFISEIPPFPLNGAYFIKHHSEL